MGTTLRRVDWFDPGSVFVRRYAPELRGAPDGAVHRPWALDAAIRSALRHPERIVDHARWARRVRGGRASGE